LPGAAGLFPLIVQPALHGPLFQQRGPVPGVEPTGKTQGPGVLKGRLPMGPEPGGTIACRRSEFEHGVGVAGLLGVLGQAG
jgi:hypothetical protein